MVAERHSCKDPRCKRCNPRAIDLSDGMALRAYYESLRSMLDGVRSSNISKWMQLESVFDPGTARWDATDAQNQSRKDYSITNETAQLALRTLKAGMLTGMSSQTRPWFKILADNQALNEKKAVRTWCESAEEVVRKVFLKSNYYESLLTLYGDEALYGTGAFLLEEDQQSVVRCHPLPIGSYWLGVDDQLRVDLYLRLYQMTARQIVERFGRENVSDATLTNYDSNAGGNKEVAYPVAHVIHKSTYFGQTDDQIARQFPWMSTWYEQGQPGTHGVLRRSGFYESPLICGRWNVVGENIWGKGAAQDCLGSTLSLQVWERLLAQAAEKHGDPPVLFGSDVDPRRANLLPGEPIFVDTKDVSKAAMPVYSVDMRLDSGLKMVERIEGRINDAMYRTLFQMFSESDRREITAEEIRARASEKMQVLGPVVERNVTEVLGPSVQRTLGICQRRGMLPPMPTEMQGQKFKLEFVSILAQAQKMSAVNNVTQFLGILGNEVAVDQGILDNVDLDEAARYVADNLSVPAKLIRAPEEVQAIRADRQRQQQQAQAAENAQKLAQAAQNLSQAKPGEGSLLDHALPALAGGAEP